MAEDPPALTPSCSDKGSWLKARLHYTGPTPMVADCNDSEHGSSGSSQCELKHGGSSYQDANLILTATAAAAPAAAGFKAALTITPALTPASSYAFPAATAPPQRRLLQPVASNAPLLFAFLAVISVLGAFGGYLIPGFYSAYMTRTSVAGVSKLYPAVGAGGECHMRGKHPPLQTHTHNPHHCRSCQQQALTSGEWGVSSSRPVNHAGEIVPAVSQIG